VGRLGLDCSDGPSGAKTSHDLQDGIDAEDAGLARRICSFNHVSILHQQLTVCADLQSRSISEWFV
jgi:hypothetical protein